MKCKLCKKECEKKYCSNSCRCKDYYKNNMDVQKERKLKYYYSIKETNYHGLRETNKKAALKYKRKVRFSGNYEKVIEKYNNQCDRCSSKENLDIHHVDKNSYWNSKNPNNSLENLVLLCASCHHKHHSSKEEDIVRPYGRP